MVHGGIKPLLGLSNNELVGRSFTDLVMRGDYLKEYRGFVLQRKMKECYLDSEVRGAEGRSATMNLALTPILVNDELTGFVCVARDVSERKKIENNLRESEEKFRSLFNSVPCGIYQCTPSGTLITANEPLARMLGYQSSDEMHGLNMNRDIYLLSKERQSVLEKKIGRAHV